MIQIVQGRANVVLVNAEKFSDDTTCLLLEFTQDVICERKFAVVQIETCPVNTLTIIEVSGCCGTTDADELAGEVELNYLGTWDVNIYDNSDNCTNLDPDQAVFLYSDTVCVNQFCEFDKSSDDVDWDDIQNKPTSFPPSPHTHPLGEITQSGATVDQVPVWDGSNWVPADLPSGDSVHVSTVSELQAVLADNSKDVAIIDDYLIISSNVNFNISSPTTVIGAPILFRGVTTPITIGFDGQALSFVNDIQIQGDVTVIGIIGTDEDNSLKFRRFYPFRDPFTGTITFGDGVGGGFGWALYEGADPLITVQDDGSGDFQVQKKIWFSADQTGGGFSGSYNDLTDVPSEFPPQPHTHPLSDIDQSGAVVDQVPVWDGSAWVAQDFPSTTVEWDDVQNKPTEFPPEAHTHDLSDLNQSGATSDQVIGWNGSEWAPIDIPTPSTPTLQEVVDQDNTLSESNITTPDGLGQVVFSETAKIIEMIYVGGIVTSAITVDGLNGYARMSASASGDTNTIRVTPSSVAIDLHAGANLTLINILQTVNGNEDVLLLNSTNQVRKTPFVLDSLNNVDTSTLEVGSRLEWDGSNWVSLPPLVLPALFSGQTANGGQFYGVGVAFPILNVAGEAITKYRLTFTIASKAGASGNQTIEIYLSPNAQSDVLGDQLLTQFTFNIDSYNVGQAVTVEEAVVTTFPTGQRYFKVSNPDSDFQFQDALVEAFQ